MYSQELGLINPKEYTCTIIAQIYRKHIQKWNLDYTSLWILKKKI